MSSLSDVLSKEELLFYSVYSFDEDLEAQTKKQTNNNGAMAESSKGLILAVSPLPQNPFLVFQDGNTTLTHLYSRR